MRDAKKHNIMTVLLFSRYMILLKNLAHFQEWPKTKPLKAV